MINKICCRCHNKFKADTHNFNKNVTKKDGLSGHCKECNKEYLIDHYAQNKSYYKNKTKKSKEIVKRWYKKYKSGLKCIKCGENHPACIEFHHVGLEKKEKNIAAMISQGSSINKIKREISKCIVLCSNCHHKLHYSKFF